MQQPPHGAKAATTRQTRKRPQTTMTENGDKKPRSFPPPACICTLSPSDAPTLRPCGNKSQDRLPTFRHCTEVAGWGRIGRLPTLLWLSLSHCSRRFPVSFTKRGPRCSTNLKAKVYGRGNYGMTNCRYGTQTCPLPLVPEGVLRGGGKKNAFRDQILLPTITFPYSHFCSAASVVVATGLSFSYLFTSPNPPPLPSLPFIPSIQQLAAP